MATMSAEDMPGLVGLDASSVPAVGLNASLEAAKAFELKKSQNAAKR